MWKSLQIPNTYTEDTFYTTITTQMTESTVYRVPVYIELTNIPVSNNKVIKPILSSTLQSEIS